MPVIAWDVGKAWLIEGETLSNPCRSGAAVANGIAVFGGVAEVTGGAAKELDELDAMGRPPFGCWGKPNVACGGAVCADGIPAADEAEFGE